MSKKPTCCNCGADVDEDTKCNVCGEYFCDDCEINTPAGSHEPEDHLDDPWAGLDEDDEDEDCDDEDEWEDDDEGSDEDE